MLQNGRFVFTTAASRSPRSALSDGLRSGGAPGDTPRPRSGHFIPFSSFSTGLLLQDVRKTLPGNERQRSPEKPLRAESGCWSAERVLTLQEGRLHAERALDRVLVLVVVWWMKQRLHPLVHFQTGSNSSAAPPPRNAPVGRFYLLGGTQCADVGGASDCALFPLA